MNLSLIFGRIVIILLVLIATLTLSSPAGQKISTKDQVRRSIWINGLLILVLWTITKTKYRWPKLISGSIMAIALPSVEFTDIDDPYYINVLKSTWYASDVAVMVALTDAIVDLIQDTRAEETTK